MSQKYNPEEIQIQDDAPEQVREVLKDFQHFIELFTNRSKEYGNHAFVLGSRGQFADISRKMGKMRTAIWDGQPEKLKGEDIYEVMNDLIGHCFLTIQCLRKEGFEEKPVAGVIKHSKIANPQLDTLHIVPKNLIANGVVDATHIKTHLVDKKEYGDSYTDADLGIQTRRLLNLPPSPEEALAVLRHEIDKINVSMRNKNYAVGIEDQKGNPEK